MITAVVFDMDGLLIDSEPLWFKAKEDLMKMINHQWTWSDQTNTMGVSTQTWIDYIFTKAKGVLSKDEILKGIIDRMKSYYSRGEIELMPGAVEALTLAKRKYKVGLASGSYKELLDIAVKVNGWEQIFDEILSSDDMERGKPYPDIYLEVMRRLGVNPEETIILEDSRDGMMAGIAAGAKVIGVPNKEIPVPSETLESAYVIINSLREFSKVLLGIND